VEIDFNDIQACLNGDNDAYRRLMQRYEPQIVRLMWRFTRDRNEVEQLVQEAFVEAFFSLKSYKGQGPFLHWLNKIATRVGYRFWKQRDRAGLFVPMDDMDNFDAVDESNANEIDSAQAAEVLHSLFNRLQATDRLILTLMYFEECSIEEIAKRTGWTKAGTKMRAMRARGKLKKLAEKENFSEKFEWIK
jgi:RNA polymerase sigma-70 factor (ECF subfamily)